MKARHGGTCPWCPEPIRPGDDITLGAGSWRHARCDARPGPVAEPERRRPARGQAFGCERCADLGFVTTDVQKNSARTVPCGCQPGTSLDTSQVVIL